MPPPLHIASPLLESRPLSVLLGSPVLLKLDNLQPSGSFKIRGVGFMIQKVWLCAPLMSRCAD